MIQIALHRSLSWAIAYSDVKQWQVGDMSHRLRDKSADCRRAHVVGWVEIFRCRLMSSAGAFLRNAKEINMRCAISYFYAALASS